MRWDFAYYLSMLKALLWEFVDFFRWYFIKAPRYIFLIIKRAAVLTNFNLGLSLTAKLLFTPLFRDYTLVGRLIGLCFRISALVLSFLVMASLLIVALLLPSVWYLFPVFLFVYAGAWGFPVCAFIFLVRLIFSFNSPKKRIARLDGSDITEAFRPSLLHYLNWFEQLDGVGVARFLMEDAIKNLLKRTELTYAEFCERLAGTNQRADGGELTQRAFSYAKNQGARFVELEHLFLALLSSTPKIDDLLMSFSSSLKICEQAVHWVIAEKDARTRMFLWQEDYEMPVIGGIDRGMTGRITPALDSVSQDFTKMVGRKYINKVIGHEKEMEQIVQLLGSSRVNVLLIGEPGCGKTTFVKGLAFDILKGTKHEALKFKRLVSVELGALVAGTKSSGDVAGKIKAAMDEAQASGGIIIFMDEIHTLLTGQNADGVLAALEPYMSRGAIQFIGATNMENYRKYIEQNGAFSRLFEVLEIPEASPEATLSILEEETEEFEELFNVLITYPALVKTVELSKKLIHERGFPDKALSVLNRAIVREQEGDRYVTSHDVAEVVAEMTHVPSTILSQSDADKLLYVENDMKKFVIGQDLAIDQLSKALKRAKTGVRDEKKPIASFLFVGTTGVGKTETAKTLAKIYFGDEKAMIRLDMSEYQQQDSINRLIGSPDGKMSGILTDAIRARPFSLILLDEVEKAYSNILLTFLQVLDDGRLTDSLGHLVDFTNTIIIATSNVGTRAIQDVFGKSSYLFDEIQEVVYREVRGYFAPEFLNRFTGIVVFKPLSVDSVRKIAQLMLKRVKTAVKDKGIDVAFKPELVTELVRRGYSLEMGARPLARVVEDSVETYLAQGIISGRFAKGTSVELGVEVF